MERSMVFLAGDNHGADVIDIVEQYCIDRDVEYTRLDVEDKPLAEILPQVKDLVLDAQAEAVVSCGTGIGVEVGINKFRGIRACLATDPEIASWAKIYDKCNVLCLAGWKDDKELVYHILDAWFSSEYDGSEERLKMFDIFNTWS